MLVSIKELKTHLSKYLHLAEAGEPVVVTSHEKPVATLVPIGSFDPKSRELIQLLGPSVQWNGQKPEGGKNKPKLEKGNASQLVLEDRR